MASTGDELDGWIARLREIPDGDRAFTADPARAEREMGVDAALARELIARGLPHADGEDGPRFWPTDLHYLGLRLGCATLYQGVLNRWAGALTAFSARPATDVEIRCSAYAPRGTPVELLVAPGERLRANVGDRAAPLRFEATTRGAWPSLDGALDGALGALLADLATYDFCWLQPPRETDLAFVRRTRLANCLSPACLLVEEAPRLGIEARLAHGLLLAPPYSTPHNWAELRAPDGTWTPLDPLLLGLLARFAGLDPEAWPPGRSPGAVLLRLGEPGAPLLRAAEDGAPLEATFLTKALVAT
jgi:hypothetical protein